MEEVLVAPKVFVFESTWNRGMGGEAAEGADGLECSRTAPEIRHESNSAKDLSKEKRVTMHSPRRTIITVYARNIYICIYLVCMPMYLLVDKQKYR